jgi:SAM-dependent methyltransferase
MTDTHIDSLYFRTLRSIVFDVIHFDVELMSIYLNFLKNTISAQMSGSVNFSQEKLFWDRLFHERKIRFGAVVEDEPSAIVGSFLSETLNRFTDRFTGELKFVDVGCGPFSKLCLSHGADERNIEVTGVDPLADFYSHLHKKYATNYGLKFVQGSGEKLLSLFPKETFHLAFTQNALDHSSNPVLFVQNMYDIVKHRGYLMFVGYNRTGTAESWTGLHQWDIEAVNDDLLLTNKSKTINRKSLTADLGLSLVSKKISPEHVGIYFMNYKKI